MGVAHVGLVHRDSCECKVKGFRAVSSIERNVSKRRHLQGVRHVVSLEAVVAPLHGMLVHMGLECRVVVMGGCHGAKSFLLPERAPRM